MTQLPFFDISNNNGSGIITRALSGIGFIAKCTEGATFRDSLYPGFMSAGRNAGECLGSYHFAHWANDPVREAAFYGSVNGRRPGEFEFLDWEMYGAQANCPASVHGPWVAAFLRARPLAGLYTNADMMTKIIASASPADLALIRSRVFWKATFGQAVPGNSFGFANGVSLWQWRDTQGIDEDWSFLTPTEWRTRADGSSTITPEGFLMALSDAEQHLALTTILNIEKQGQVLGPDGKVMYDWNPAINNNIVGLAGNIGTVMAALANLSPDALATAVVAKLPVGHGLTADDVKAALLSAIGEKVTIGGDVTLSQSTPSVGPASPRDAPSAPEEESFDHAAAEARAARRSDPTAV